MSLEIETLKQLPTGKHFAQLRSENHEFKQTVREEINGLIRQMKKLTERVEGFDSSNSSDDNDDFFDSDDDRIAEFSSVSSDEWMALDEAYNEALQKGYKGSKDAFRKWVNRKPNEARAQLGIIYDPDRSGRAGNYRPYRIQSEVK